MRGKNDVLQPAERKIARRRLDFEDVQRSGRDMAPSESISQRRFVYETSTGAVHDSNTFLT